MDVVDGTFHVVSAAGAFVDPDLPPAMHRSGSKNLQGRIYVAYAKQDDEAADEVAGPGLGFVSAFDASGSFARPRRLRETR